MSRYIKLIIAGIGFIIIVLNKKQLEKAKYRFITGEDNGKFGLITLYGLRLYLSILSKDRIKKENESIWNSKAARKWHKKKDNNSNEIDFFVKQYNKFIVNIPNSIETIIEIGAGNGKNLLAIKNYIYTTENKKYIGVDFQIEKNDSLDIVVQGGAMDSCQYIDNQTLVLTSGTMMYFDTNEINELMSSVSKQDAKLLIFEPTYNDDFNYFRINPLVTSYSYEEIAENNNLTCIQKEKISEDKYMTGYGYLFIRKEQYNDTI